MCFVVYSWLHCEGSPAVFIFFSVHTSFSFSLSSFFLACFLHFSKLTLGSVDSGSFEVNLSVAPTSLELRLFRSYTAIRAQHVCSGDVVQLFHKVWLAAVPSPLTTLALLLPAVLSTRFMSLVSFLKDVVSFLSLALSLPSLCCSTVLTSFLAGALSVSCGRGQRAPRPRGRGRPPACAPRGPSPPQPP